MSDSKEIAKLRLKRFFEKCDIDQISIGDMDFLESFTLSSNQKTNNRRITQVLLGLKEKMIESDGFKSEGERENRRKAKDFGGFRATSSHVVPWEILCGENQCQWTFRNIRREVELDLEPFWFRLLQLFYSAEIQKDKYRVKRREKLS